MNLTPGKNTILERSIKSAFEEDEGAGDFSTLSCISKDAQGKAVLKIKEEGLLAGVDIAAYIFSFKDADVEFQRMMNDGDWMKPGDTAFEVTGSIATILVCERIVLNCMQRMCGIATLTSTYVNKIKPYKSKLLDTRKTTPNFRYFEKEAVRIGGGYNHRFGLYDMIMLKDNHIDFCGGISNAIRKARSFCKEKNLDLKIEVEVRNLEEVKEALATGQADRIMLDNFSPALVSEALKIIDHQCETEASGNINLNTIESYAATGVDFISAGAIIHQARSIDLSLKAAIKQ